MRLAAIALALTLVGSTAPGTTAPTAPTAPGTAAPIAPAAPTRPNPPTAAAQLLPPESSATTPASAIKAAPAVLKRLGVLRVPAIGLYVNVYYWGCGSSTVPNLALRWGCKPSNNQFIIGHGYGIFNRYLVGYNLKRLRVGIIATFTTTAGKTTRYKLAWTRKVVPTYLWSGLTGAEWAWENTAIASLTLQTCWGSTNAYRIVTRFVRG